MGFNLMYYFPMCGLYFFFCSNLEKFGKIWKYGRFSGRIRPDWGNTARADMAGLGSIGLRLRPFVAFYYTLEIFADQHYYIFWTLSGKL